MYSVETEGNGDSENDTAGTIDCTASGVVVYDGALFGYEYDGDGMLMMVGSSDVDVTEVGE